MGSKLGGGDDDVIADINITPFVDIILVILIIFMVTATKIVAVPVQLPDAATGEQAETISLGITLGSDGTLLLDGEPTTPEGLRVRIREVKQETDDVICLIAADKASAFGRVTWLLDLVRAEGVGKYAFQINRAEFVSSDPAQSGAARGVLEGDG